MKLKKRLISLFFSFAMVLGLGIGMAPQTALAASNSTVVFARLHRHNAYRRKSVRWG